MSRARLIPCPLTVNSWLAVPPPVNPALKLSLNVPLPVRLPFGTDQVLAWLFRSPSPVVTLRKLSVIDQPSRALPHISLPSLPMTPYVT